jgi:hypothetical protein
MNADKAAIILARLEAGESLRAICRTDDFPSESMVRKIVQQDPEGFGAQYMRARTLGYEALADELMEIADTPEIGVIKTVKPDGSVEEKFADMLEHRRMRIDSRKWMLSKMLPKVYGEKVDHNLTGTVHFSKISRQIVDPT